MGTCLSKKKNSCTSSPVDGPKSLSKAPSGNGVTVTHPEVNLKKEKKLVQEKQDPLAQEDESQVKKEIFIIKHRKSHDDNRERSSKIPPLTAQQNVSPQQTDGSVSVSVSASSASTNEASESMGNNKIAPSTPNIGVVGLRTSSCTKEEVDAILIQCGRLSRSSSGRAASSSAASGGRKYSGSKRSFDFDHCDNDTISADDDQKRANANATEEYDGVAAEKRQHRQRHRQSPRGSSCPSQGRRRTPSRERDQQQQRSSSRERRVSRSPGRRSSETNAATANANNNNNNNSTSSRPGKLVSVPATVSSLVMDKSNNGGGGVGESAASSGIKRMTVKRNVGDGSRGAASPRSQSPARANGNAANATKVLSENQQPSLSRNNSSRKAEQSPYRRNPLSEIDPNSLAYPQSNTNNSSNKLQNRPKKETEAEANQKANVDMNENGKIRTGSRVALEKGVSVNWKAKEQQEEEIKVLSSVTDNVVVKTVIPSGVDNLKLTRSRSGRRSRDLDLNPEALLNPTLSYTSLLLEDIQNFHQKTTQQQPSISLPACLTKACSILEAVADLNSTTSSNPPSYETVVRKNECNVPLNANHCGKRVPSTKDYPFGECEVVVSDDVMEPSLHKYVTVKRGGSLGGVVDMEDQESSGSNSFSVVSGQQHWSNISSSWEPNSADSTDCWTSREELEGSDMKTLNSKKRECDHQHSNGIGRGRLGSSNKSLHTLPVVTAAAST